MSCYAFLTVFKGVICLQKEFAGYLLHSIYKFQVSGFLFRMKLGVGQKLESGLCYKSSDMFDMWEAKKVILNGNT